MNQLSPQAADYLTEWLGPGCTAEPLAGDASARVYFRIRTPENRTCMLAWYPPEDQSQLRRFLSAYEAIAAYGRVPDVLRYCDTGVLQYDVGDRTLYDTLHENRDEGLGLYTQAIELLAGFQKAPDPALNAPFNSGFFLAELDMAREFYVEKLMGADGSGLTSFMTTIAENLARHPYILCHRDFHGQNLHVVNDTLYLIDYQDLRMGPDTYDMASLLRDRGVARILGDEAELSLLDHYARVTGAEGDIRQRYFETLLQRSIKILGTFSKQPIVRGRMHYLDFIPPTLESVRRCLEELPAYASLRDIFPLSFDLDEARRRVRDLQEP